MRRASSKRSSSIFFEMLALTCFDRACKAGALLSAVECTPAEYLRELRMSVGRTGGSVKKKRKLKQNIKKTKRKKEREEKKNRKNYRRV